MSRRRRPRGRPAVPAVLTPVAEWDAPPPAEAEPPLTLATQPIPSAEPGTDVVPAADPTALTPELAAAVAGSKLPICAHCGGRHLRACPRIREMRFHADGALAAVVFWRDGQWSDDYVLWPDEVAVEE